MHRTQSALRPPRPDEGRTQASAGPQQRAGGGPQVQRLVMAGLSALAVALGGCTNLSGLGGSSEFQCKAPDGVPCQSISGVHHNERSGNLPFQRPVRSAAHEQASAPAATAPGRGSSVLGTGGAVVEGPGPQPNDAAAAPAQAVLPQYRKATVPSPHRIGPGGFGAIRSDPVVIRMWVAPWEDADGDLNDQSYVYMQVDSGWWLIEHNRAQVRREFAPRAADGARPVVTTPAAAHAPAHRPSTASLTTPSTTSKGPSASEGTQAVRPTLPPEAVEALRRAAQQGAARGAAGPAPAGEGLQGGKP